MTQPPDPNVPPGDAPTEGSYPPPPPGGGYAQTKPPPGYDYGQQQPPPGPGPGYGQQAGPGYGQQAGPSYGQPGPSFPGAMPQAPAYDYGQQGMGVAPPGMFIDAESGLALPQGTELASIGRRIGAFFLAIPLAIVTLGIGYAIWGLIVWGQGTSPALQVLGMRCWRPQENRVPGWGWMALRNAIGCLIERAVSIIGIISFIFMCVDRNRRSLHDLIAGTVVLHDPNKVLAPPKQ
jgi:uncharacterized RDD family membrane protein YckC